jgi:hypothetical protein
MSLANLSKIEKNIRKLTEEEQLFLMERMIHRLRSKKNKPPERKLELELAEMANDPEIQTEIEKINTEFSVAEFDGLR